MHPTGRHPLVRARWEWVQDYRLRARRVRVAVRVGQRAGRDSAMFRAA